MTLKSSQINVHGCLIDDRSSISAIVVLILGGSDRSLDVWQRNKLEATLSTRVHKFNLSFIICNRPHINFDSRFENSFQHRLMSDFDSFAMILYHHLRLNVHT